MEFWESKENLKNEYFGGITDSIIKGNSVVFQADKGILRIKVLSSKCIRMTFTWKKEFLDIPSFAVAEESVFNDFTIEETVLDYIIKTSEIIISIAKDNGSIKICDTDGNIVSQDFDSGFSWTKETIKCRKTMEKNDHFYGLGEKTGFLDKRGRKYMMWNTDEPLHLPLRDPLYKSIPFLIAFNEENTYGLFIDKTCKTWFDLGEESEEYFAFETDDFEIDYYFIYGRDMKQVIGTYTELTGRMYLPPKWALGYQQCRWSYFPEENLKQIANSFRERKIPCDVLYLDIDYMDEYRDFTWNHNRFPDPEKMLKDLRKDGFKVVTIVDPGVKKDAEYDVYMDGLRKDVYCKKPTGEVYHGKVWPGDAAYPDFTKEAARKWWGSWHKELIGKGIAGIWNDMNEPSDFSPESNGDRTLVTVPNDLIMENEGYPRSFRRYHNCYGLNMCRGTLEGFREIKPDERPFVVTRSAYAGIQRYSSVWTGDNHSWWEHMASAMPMHMNIGMSGVPFVGGDVGGFQGNASPELFARWMQLGAFTPFFRAHSEIGSKPHEPWAFGSEIENICKKYIELRYKLLPYNYSEFYKASVTGLPIMKPLVLEYPGDENVHNLSDQFMYGDHIMIAPVYRPSVTKRCVYIPKGNWYNYWTGEKYEGMNYIIADAPLDILPIFIREGSIIPTAPVMNYVGEAAGDAVTLDIYCGQDSDYTLYEDDGTSNRYKDGEYSLTIFELKTEENKLLFKIIPSVGGYKPKRDIYNLRFHNLNISRVKIKCDTIISSEIKNNIFEITIPSSNTPQQIELQQ